MEKQKELFSITTSPGNIFRNAIDCDFHLLLDSSIQIVFNGIFNGFNVEVHSPNEIALLHNLGCFGRHSGPRVPTHSNGNVAIMRQRQYSKRSYWQTKFSKSSKVSPTDELVKEMDKLSSKLMDEHRKRFNRVVIDLVSSEDESSEEGNENDILNPQDGEMVVIVPNSDSEGETFFEKLKPKCCVSRVTIKEKLYLMPEEAFFLVYGLGCLQISHNNRILSTEVCWDLFCKFDKNFVTKYIVYHYFRSKGYIVKPGIKFGGNYVLYKEGPGVAHAEYVVVIKSGNVNASLNNWITVLGHIRMVSTTSKIILVAEVIGGSQEQTSFSDLGRFSIRETILSRHIPNSIINDDID